MIVVLLLFKTPRCLFFFVRFGDAATWWTYIKDIAFRNFSELFELNTLIQPETWQMDMTSVDRLPPGCWAVRCAAKPRVNAGRRSYAGRMWRSTKVDSVLAWLCPTISFLFFPEFEELGAVFISMTLHTYYSYMILALFFSMYSCVFFWHTDTPLFQTCHPPVRGCWRCSLWVGSSSGPPGRSDQTVDAQRWASYGLLLEVTWSC